jgi:outer membrane protein OmpA-like peptidoglycan-associated protein
MHRILFLFSISLFAVGAQAQQQASKAKSAVKIYEKNGVSIRNAAGVNTGKLEFSPTYYQNGIVYVSSRYKSGPVDKKIGETFFELFYAETDAEGMPQNPQPFSLSVNSQVHEGPVSFSRDGNLLYFTRNNLDKGIAKANTKRQVVMKVYEARRGKYDWENVKELPFNSDDYTCVHPALAADGKRLFFASDMPGGYGGMDLYFVERRGENWSKPINLGPDVNTTGNEVFPYLHESGVLFFSSNGHGGAGGLDIFKIDISGSVWSALQNLGDPFNSAKDDLGFIINEESTNGFFASDRTDGGAGKDDIYRFDAAPLVDQSDQVLPATVVVFNEQTKERIEGADVRLFQRSADGMIEDNDAYDVQLLPSDNGDLVMKLVRKSPDDMGKTGLQTDGDGQVSTSMRAGKSYLLLVTKEGYQSAEIMHATAGATGPQTVRVPLKTRACATTDGVVSVEGYRTKVPNALVRIVNETNGTEELLRSGSGGEFDFCLPLNSNFTVYAEKEGYEKGMTKISTREAGVAQKLNVAVSLKPLSEGILKEPIREGSVIVLENIYYDFNQYFIRKGAARELDALAQLMKLYPSMEIEMIAHTDARGTEQYNLDLSLKRAESARRYLTQQGIADNRIRAFGYGESQVRNHCKEGTECTDEEHQFNRRTEVKVTRIDEPVKVQYQEGNPQGY